MLPSFQALCLLPGPVLGSVDDDQRVQIAVHITLRLHNAHRAGIHLLELFGTLKYFSKLSSFLEVRNDVPGVIKIQKNITLGTSF